MKMERVRLFLNLENGSGGHFLNILSQFAATDKLRGIERKNGENGENWKMGGLIWKIGWMGGCWKRSQEAKQHLLGIC